MQFPAMDDTIIAVSSGWAATRIGIVRLSGPESFALAQSLGAASPPPSAGVRPRWSEGRIQLDQEASLPATVFWFRRPRSYTGQDLVELHAPGCLPLLRELCGRLIERGARRALPGEFTARAFLAGKLSAEQVEDVLALLHSRGDFAARQAGREARASQHELLAAVRERVADLLALSEASIDFVEEEDIRLVAASEVLATIDELLGMLQGVREREQRDPRASKPRVALVGLPNAGKSTLFNALVGYERALVSPVLGTTRDVLSAEIEVDGMEVILQDCAGLGESEDELELAAHQAAERTADQADLVLWVHAADMPCLKREAQAAARFPPARCLLVWSKVDAAVTGVAAPVPSRFSEVIRTSAATGMGLTDLRDAISRRLTGVECSTGGHLIDDQVRAASAALARAQSLVSTSPGGLAQPELVAIELRTAYESISEQGFGALVEDVLARVFSQFCVGK